MLIQDYLEYSDPVLTFDRLCIIRDLENILKIPNTYREDSRQTSVSMLKMKLIDFYGEWLYNIA